MRAPGALLLHPVALGALLTLLANDQLLKRLWPGVVSGKLSDVAGMVLCPLVLHAAVELGAAKATRPLSLRASGRVLFVAVLATALGFTLAELTTLGDTAYRFGLGALQWPFQAFLALASGAGLSSLRPVSATPDPTDLLALPFGLVALRLGGHRLAPGRAVASAAAAVLVAGVLAPRSAHAVPLPNERKDPASERRHDGFYLDFDLGGGGFFLSSQASISNGFRQPIASSARGSAFPSLSIAAGGTLPRTSLVIGGRITRVETSEPVISTLDHRFRLPQFRLAYTDFSVFARYYPNPYGGLHVGGALGVLGLSAQTSADPFYDQDLPESRGQTGISLSPEVGHGFWLRNEISAGLVLRTTVARTFGSEGGATLVVPALLASLIWN